MINGLETITEVESIKVDSQNIAPFSLPEEVLRYIPGPEEVVTSFKNGAKERKIYSNVELTHTEQAHLKLLQEEAKRQGKKFLPWIAASATRYITRSGGDAVKALKEMQATQDWRCAFFRDGPLSDESVVNDMQHGIVYFGARDRSLRPALILRPARIPPGWLKGSNSNRLLKLLVFCMEYMVCYMCLPGHVETAVVIIDLSGATLSQVPLGSIRETIKVLSQHYLYRVHKFYVCNVPRYISRMSSWLMSMLTDRQKQKLFVVKSPEEIQPDFALHHLETDLGGTRPMITRFFPFPLEAGPFAGNCRSGANADAVPNLHEAITEAGFRGHVWDATRSYEENVLIGYSEAARQFFKHPGLALPGWSSGETRNKSWRDDSISLSVGDMPEAHASRISISSATTEAGSCTDDASQVAYVASTTTDDDLVEDCEIEPAMGLFWSFCMPRGPTGGREHRTASTTTL